MTPARILDRAMASSVCSRHDHIFIIRQRWQSADPFCPQWVENYTVVETSSIDEVVDWIMKLDGPKAVIEVIIGSGLVNDVSREFARKVAYRIRQGEECTRDRLDFVETYFAPGRLLPAIA